MDPVVARKMWRTLEPLHGIVYFAADAGARYRALGLPEHMHYFPTRAAAMGPVPAEVVMATFFNFHPAVVRAAIPAAWVIATPEQILAARVAGAGDVLRRILGDAVDSPEVAEAAGLARAAAEACPPQGRPLFAGHASLPWPGEPHLALWHAITLLREFRGDGHVALLLIEGLDGCEALVVHGATGEVPTSILQSSRAWPDDEWGAATERVRARGWLDREGQLTDAGREHRDRVEHRTDELALAPWQSIGEDACDRLRGLVRPLSKAIVASGELGFRRP